MVTDDSMIRFLTRCILINSRNRDAQTGWLMWVGTPLEQDATREVWKLIIDNQAFMDLLEETMGGPRSG